MSISPASTSKSAPAPSPISLARMEKYELALKEALPIESLKIDDESYLHAGHVGAQGGAGHYRIFIKSCLLYTSDAADE